MDKMLVRPTFRDNIDCLDSYSLYPDAGEVGDLDAPTLPLFAPPSEPTPLSKMPEIPNVAPAEPNVAPAEPNVVPAEPNVVLAEPTVVLRPTYVQRRRKHRLSHLCVLLLALVGAGVYAGLLWNDLCTLGEVGLGQWAAEAVFGTTHTVTMLETAGETLRELETSAPIPIPIETERDAPPANEGSTALPVTEVLSKDLSSRSVDGLGLINETPYTPDLSALAKTDPVIDSYTALESIYGKGCPAVLILHTHGTEAFADQAENGYHTVDTEHSIVQVGSALAHVLTENGIGVIHCTELFDESSFDMAYYNAARTIRETLEEHPSIRYILDIHRDAITNADDMGIRPLSVENDTEYAQLMFVVGTDHGGSGHTEWKTNLALAARLQSVLHTDHPTLMRDINLRSASFNAQYAPGALLIEAGAACSTLDEAVRSIQLFGKAIAKEIKREG